MDTSSFGEYLKGIRKQNRLSARQLAELTGISQSYISQVENGHKGIPSPEILKKISQHLNHDYYDLMREAGYLIDVEIKPSLKEVLNEIPTDFIGSVIEEEIKSVDEITYEKFKSKAKSNDLINALFLYKNVTPEEISKITSVPLKLLNDFLEEGYVLTKQNLLKIGKALGVDDLVTWLQTYTKWVGFAEQFDEFMSPPKISICFEVESSEEIEDENGVITTHILSQQEVKQRFLSLENILTMDRPIYYKKSVVTEKDRERILKMLALLLEK